MVEISQEELSRQITVITEGTEFMVCETRQDYELLCKREDAAVAFKKQVEDYWDPLVKKAHEVHKDLTGKRGAHLKPLEAFLAAVKKIGGGYLAAEQAEKQRQADIVAAEAARIREQQEAEARKAAEALKARQDAELAAQRAKQEADRKAAAAEQARKEAEFKNSPAEKARLAAEFKAKQEAERLEQERQAEILRVRQAEDRAEADRQAKARMLDLSQVPQAPTKADAGEGRATVETYDYEVTDEALIPRQFMEPAHKAIKAVVVALKDKTNIPGIRVIKNTGVRRTGK
ncbi:MAG: hypothetical protein WC469_06025 [Candidatus Omnitrophota bacterium]